MTAKEAIFNLKMIRVAFVEPVTKEQRELIDDTFDMAIKALEIEPCENAINREFLLRDLLLKAQGEKDVSIKWLEEYINSLPSVTPQEPKTGHWIFDDECKEHGHCPHCGYGRVDLVDGEPHNFCRNCGAKMQEVEA